MCGNFHTFFMGSLTFSENNRHDFTCKYFGCFRSTAFEANEFEDQIEAYNSYKKITPSPSDLNGMYICHDFLST